MCRNRTSTWKRSGFSGNTNLPSRLPPIHLPILVSHVTPPVYCTISVYFSQWHVLLSSSHHRSRLAMRCVYGCTCMYRRRYHRIPKNAAPVVRVQRSARGSRATSILRKAPFKSTQFTRRLAVPRCTYQSMTTKRPEVPWELRMQKVLSCCRRPHGASESPAIDRFVGRLESWTFPASSTYKSASARVTAYGLGLLSFFCAISGCRKRNARMAACAYLNFSASHRVGNKKALFPVF